MPATPRTPRAPRKTAAKKPGRQPMDRLRAEAERVEGQTVGTLCGKQLLVKPETEWRSSALHALRIGDFQEWARTALEDDGYLTWLQLDPTLQQIHDFIDTWEEVTGQDMGESAAS